MCRKDEYNRKLILVTKKLREVSEALGISNNSPRAGFDSQGDVMLSRRPFGQCASCEKDLINMHGIRADHYTWNKLPFRDPAERIAKFGNGFSHRLSMITSKASKFETTRSTHRKSRQNKSIENMPLKDIYSGNREMMSSTPAELVANIRSKTHLGFNEGEDPGHQSLPALQKL